MAYKQFKNGFDKVQPTVEIVAIGIRAKMKIAKIYCFESTWAVRDEHNRREDGLVPHGLKEKMIKCSNMIRFKTHCRNNVVVVTMYALT